MAIFKCKMCGGTIEFEQGATVGICDSCGTKQTLPRLTDDKKENLYSRANHFRLNNEYDKAMALYEQILNEDDADAESYWSLVLCRYGIEYVKDPATHKQIPTVNRAQFTSIFADEDYKSALQYADGYQKAIYEEEAKAIDEIQKGILEISSKEDPFDVFICYKETDASGRRTQDSVLANDLYHQLTQEGFKVFFSRITLEDKLGTAYEPYIFAALNSAKVMVVLGTNPEYFNAVWVKNEWSRYLALIKNGAKKTLIPAYRDMDPYDLPEEFSHLQAQDMSKLGFMQDLIRGIKKIVDKEPKAEQKREPASTGEQANISSLLKRTQIFLEDENWNEADKYCEKILDIDPENGDAYLFKLLCALKVSKVEELANVTIPLDRTREYKNAIRFADEKTSKVLVDYNQSLTVKIREKLASLQKKKEDAAKCVAKQQENIDSIKVSLESSYVNLKEVTDYKKVFRAATWVLLMGVLSICCFVLFFVAISIDNTFIGVGSFLLVFFIPYVRMFQSWDVIKAANKKIWVFFASIFAFGIPVTCAAIKVIKQKPKMTMKECDSLSTSLESSLDAANRVLKDKIDSLESAEAELEKYIETYQLERPNHQEETV